MTAPKPVVTMNEERTLLVNGTSVGGVGDWGEHAFLVEDRYTAADLRAIADFLDQLAGANLLSEVTAG